MFFAIGIMFQPGPIVLQGLLESGSKLFSTELFAAIDRGCSDDELHAELSKGSSPSLCLIVDE